MLWRKEKFSYINTVEVFFKVLRRSFEQVLYLIQSETGIKHFNQTFSAGGKVIELLHLSLTLKLKGRLDTL